MRWLWVTFVFFIYPLSAIAVAVVLVIWWVVSIYVDGVFCTWAGFVLLLVGWLVCV